MYPDASNPVDRYQSSPPPGPSGKGRRDCTTSRGSPASAHRVWGWGAGRIRHSASSSGARTRHRASTRRLTSALAGVHAYEATPDVTALQSCRTVWRSRSNLNEARLAHISAAGSGSHRRRRPKARGHLGPASAMRSTTERAWARVRLQIRRRVSGFSIAFTVFQACDSSFRQRKWRCSPSRQAASSSSSSDVRLAGGSTTRGVSPQKEAIVMPSPKNCALSGRPFEAWPSGKTRRPPPRTVWRGVRTPRVTMLQLLTQSWHKRIHACIRHALNRGDGRRNNQAGQFIAARCLPFLQALQVGAHTASVNARSRSGTRRPRRWSAAGPR